MSARLATAQASNPLATASSLPPEWYVGEANFGRECQTLWSRSWVSVARAEDLQSSGDYVTATVGSAPVVVVRGLDNVLRGFANVCPHRGSVLMQGAGRAPALQCPYHAWTFSLEGDLRAAPGMAQVESFDADSICLPRLAVDVWQGWVFLNLDPNASPVQQQVGKLDALLEPYDLGSLVRVGQLDFEATVNWKLLVENFAESYHHAAVHPQPLQRDFPGQDSWLVDSGDEPWM